MPTLKRYAGLLGASALLVMIGPVPAEEVRLVALRVAAPGVISAVLHTNYLAQDPSAKAWPAPTPMLNPERWRVNGEAPQSIHRSAMPIDALPVQHGNHPVKVEHRIYLTVDSALRNGKVYRVDSPYGKLELQFSETGTRCEAIKVDQGGYHPGLQGRYANFGVFLGDGGSRQYAADLRYQVRHASDGAMVHEGAATYWGDDRVKEAPSGYRSGEHVYRLSLATVPPGGPYVISIPGCGQSTTFRVGLDTVRATARMALRGIYHQRCGIALAPAHTEYTRGICAPGHRLIADTQQPFSFARRDAEGWIVVTGEEPTRQVFGGWHDAGDFDRRISHLEPLSWWLSYFEALQERSPWRDDGWLNIPESGNGIPDFLDETSWALQSWRALQLKAPDPNQGAILAGSEASGHPVYGNVSAASDTLRYGSYGISPRATAWAAGNFAHMARLWRNYDAGQAQNWLQAALAAWDWLAPRYEGEYTVARAYAAVQLYLTTGQTDFHTAFKSRWADIRSGATSWPEQCVIQNASAECQIAQFAMYFHPRHAARADATLRREGLAWIEKVATTKAYHCARPQEPYPQCLSAWGDWGRQVTSALRSDLWVWAWILLDEHPQRAQWFDDTAVLAQFATGLNPLSRPFYTGLGPDAPLSSTHLDSYFTKFGRSDGVTADHRQRARGQVPGLLIFGPTDKRGHAPWERAVTDKLYPAWEALPRQRRWGDGWPAIRQNEVLTTNMAYQALAYTFLASIPAACTGPRSSSPSAC